MQLIKPPLAPFTAHGGGCCFGKCSSCVSSSAEQSCCSPALLVSRKTSLQLNHNDLQVCDKPWDRDITAQFVSLFTGALFKARYCSKGISLSCFALKFTRQQPGMDPIPMDTSTKHMLALGVAAKSFFKCHFWVDSTHFFQIQLEKKGFLHSQINYSGSLLF